MFKNDGSFLERFKQLQQQQPNTTEKQVKNDVSLKNEEKILVKPTESGNFSSDSKVNNDDFSSGKGGVKTEESSSSKKSSFKMKLPSLKKPLTLKGVQDTPTSDRDEFESDEEQKYDIKNGKGFRFSDFILL